MYLKTIFSKTFTRVLSKDTGDTGNSAMYEGAWVSYNTSLGLCQLTQNCSPI